MSIWKDIYRLGRFLHYEKSFATIGVVSGHFLLGPTPGHLSMFEDAWNRVGCDGYLVVVVNNDAQIKQKGTWTPYTEDERLRLIDSIKFVRHTALAIDEDRSVCESLNLLRPHYFFNGPEYTEETCRETQICRELGIQMVFGVGGNKTHSSSEIINRAKQV